MRQFSPLSLGTAPEAASSTKVWIPDSRLLVPSLSKPKVAPIEAVEIDWTHPLARGLTLVNLTRSGYTDFTGNTPDSVGASNAIDRHQNGAYFTSSGSAYEVIYKDDDKFDGDRLTFVAGVIPNSLTGSRSYIGKFGDGAGVDSWILRSSGGASQFGVKTSASWAIASGPSLTVGKFHIVSGTYDGANVISYLDGVAGTPVAKTGSTSSAAKVHVGNAGSSVTTEYGDAKQFFAFGWNRALSSAEIASLSRNPYQFLKSKKDLVPLTITPVIVQTLSIDYPAVSTTLYEPAVSPGAVTVSLDYPAVATALYEPAVSPGAVTVSLDYPTPSTTLYDPSVAIYFAIALSYISPTTALYEPTLTPGAITLSLDYFSSTALYEPVISPVSHISLTYISPETTLYEPALVTQQFLSLDYISTTTALYEPAVSPIYTVSLDYLAPDTTLYEPALSSSYTVSLDYPGVSTALHEPAVSPGAYTLSLDYPAASTALYEPGVKGVTTRQLGYIAPTSTAFELTVSPGAYTLGLDFLDASATMYEPFIAWYIQPLDLNFLAASTTMFELAVLHAVTVEITPAVETLTLYERPITLRYDVEMTPDTECLQLIEGDITMTSFREITPDTDELQLLEIAPTVSTYTQLHTIQFSGIVYYDDPVAGVTFTKTGVNPTETVTPDGVLEPSGTSSIISFIVNWAVPLEAEDTVVFTYNGKTGTYSNGTISLRNQLFAIDVCA